ncbi:MAG TPA: hypothetical protein VJ859_09460 [Allosphingosinicella sp.]|nr:hypothetical protein [Allosphingosinicella sp.]
MFCSMRLSCLFGIHRPSIASIVRRPAGYAGLCETCARPLEREESGRWVACDALYERSDRAA